MRHRYAGAVRALVAVGKIIPHDLAARVLARLGKADIAMIPIGCQPLGRPVRGEVNRRLPLPVHALPAYLGQLGMADFLRDRPERCAGPDRL